jgi:hypothetical protein
VKNRLASVAPLYYMADEFLFELTCSACIAYLNYISSTITRDDYLISDIN